MRKHQVIIVGGGVGGSSAAFHMAKAGLDVLMVEKETFPRDKTCGDGQVGGIHPLLQSMGVYEEIKKYAHPCCGAMFSDAASNTHYYPEEVPTFATPRFIIDDIINKAAVNSGIDYLENYEVFDLMVRRGQVHGVRGYHNGQMVEAEADLVVLANGAHSMLSRKMGFYEENPDLVFYGLRGYYENVQGLKDYIEFHYPDEMFMPAGYIWLFPMGDCKANVGVFITESSLKKTGRTSEELLQWWIESTPLGKDRLGKATLNGKMKGWRLPTGKAQKVHGSGVIAVGDAGNMIEPLYGGGFPHAMVAGVCAAQAAGECVQKNDFSAKALMCYEEFVDKELGSGYQIQMALREKVFNTTENIANLIHFSDERFAGKIAGAGDVMAAFLVENCGYAGDTKSAYSK